MLLTEVMEGHDSRDDRRKRRGNLRIAGVCPMGFPIHDVPVNGGMQSRFDLRRRPRKLNQRASPRNVDGLKSKGRKPGRNGLYVRVGGSELLPELIGRKPLVVARGGLDLLLLEQILQTGLLIGTAL